MKIIKGKKEKGDDKSLILAQKENQVYLGIPIEDIVEINGKKPLPNIDRIIDYCKTNNLEMLDARKIVYQHFSDMFIDVPFERFNLSKRSGELFHKLYKIQDPMYFKIQRSGLGGNLYKRKMSFTNETIRKIMKDYENRS